MVTVYIGAIYERQVNTSENPLGTSVSGKTPDGIDPIMACLDLGDSPTDFGFTGQRSDSDFGLMDYNARFYSPWLGRFISPDSIVPDPTEAQSFNRYTYAEGNPLRFTDPSGHCSTLEDGAADMEGDGACWQLAYSIYGYGLTEQDPFTADWQVTPDEWLENIAKSSFATADYLQPFFDKYQNHWAARTGQKTGIPNESPPLPPSVEQYKDLYLAPLLACAQAISGVCGVSYGGTGVVPGVAVRGSGDFYVDQNGDIALYWTFGAGPAVLLFPQPMGSTGPGAVAVPNATVNDLGGYSVQLGASAAAVRGPAADLVVSVSEVAPVGISGGTAYGT